MAALSGVDRSGNVWFLKSGQAPELCFQAGNVNPELRALLAAAHILYRVSSNTKDMFEHLVAELEAKGHDQAVPSILAHQAALATAMRCATEGVEKVLHLRI